MHPDIVAPYGEGTTSKTQTVIRQQLPQRIRGCPCLARARRSLYPLFLRGAAGVPRSRATGRLDFEQLMTTPTPATYQRADRLTSTMSHIVSTRRFCSGPAASIEARSEPDREITMFKQRKFSSNEPKGFTTKEPEL